MSDDALAAALRDPAVRSQLTALLQKLDRVDAMVDTAGRFSEKVPVIADAAGATASWAWKRAEAAGIDPITAGQRGAQLLLELGRPEVLAMLERLVARRSELERVLDAFDALAPDLAPLLGNGTPGTALVAPTIEPVGPWAAFKKLGDADVKRAVGFALALAKGLGRYLGRSG